MVLKIIVIVCVFFFFSSRRRHTRSLCDWSSDVCSSDLTDADQDHTIQAAITEESAGGGEQPEWLEVEDIDPDTGELLGTHLQAIDADGEAIGEPIDPAVELAARLSSAVVKRSQQIRIGVVVPLSSLLG